jgi:hypothetical protein
MPPKSGENGMNEALNCPVCGETFCAKQDMSRDIFPGNKYDCARCGKFVLYGTVANEFSDSSMTLCRRAVLSHRLRRMQRPDGTPVPIFEAELRTFNLDDPLPSPAQQADSLILWIGDHQTSQAQVLEIPPGSEVSAWIGLPITSHFRDEGLTWLLQQPQIQVLVKEHDAINGPTRLALTFEGWQRYEALNHAQVESRTAFMAMEFDSEMDRVVKDCFKPAVARTGFELRVLTDGQRAGSIDDQLRVALRTSRFVIADLTHDNNGAYWEAGFAEGLGRPVIYTCRKQKWDATKSHFDTSHLNTIIWDPENLQDAATRLTATIRATLPTEAKMTD